MPSNDHQTGDDSVWWRSRWLDAMAVAGVKPGPRLVGYVYADFARSEKRAWVSVEQLMRATGYSRRAAIDNRSKLVTDGWLVEIEKAGQHRSARYALVIPESARGADLAPLADAGVQISTSRGADNDSQECRSRTRSISDQSKNQSLSPNRRVLMQLLDCAADDERVDAGIRLIEARQPAKPASWLRAVHSNGDLEDLIAKEMKPDTRRIPGRDYWDNGGTFFDKPSPSRTTPSVEHIICAGVLDDGSTCAQPIHPNRRDRPCIVCGQINRPTFKDVNAS